MDLGVSYVPAHLPQHIEADMRHLAEIGCNEALFALQENHFFTLTGALRFGADIARANGVRPLAVIWGYANTFGGGRISRLLLNDLEMWRRGKDGSPTPLACLNNPKLVDHFAEFTALCREHGFAGMFVDEPTPQECFCPHCQARFREEFDGDLLAAEGTADYEAFRVQTVSNYTDEVCKRVKAVDAGLETVTCIMPHDRAAWDQVVSIPELDVFGTDPYWLVSQGRMTLDEAVATAKAAKSLCQQHGKKSQVWLNAWRIPAGLEEEVYNGGKALAAVGCDSLYTWSYRAGLGTNEESEDAERTWANVARLYRELSG